MAFLPTMRRKGQPARLRTVHVPAPIGGDDTVSPGTMIPAGRSILSKNLIGAEYGLRSRLGSREYVTGLDGDPRSILPYTGSTKDGAANRLFVCTETGIWDCSASTAAPSQVVTFGTQNADSGWGNSCVFVNAAGAHFLIYCDEANGYHSYAESGSTWTVGGIPASAISNVDPALLCHVLPWKNRLWFVERDSGRGWYTDVSAASGALTSFMFGSRFKKGGDLRCLSSQSGDGGSGPDDRLAAISGGGDLLLYEGTDPATPGAFQIVGVYDVGQVPAGRRLTTETGGDLAIMSSLGILPLSRLTNGAVLYDRAQYQTSQIANLFNQLQASTSNVRGWAMRLHPQDGCMMVLVPTAAGAPCSQLAMSLTTKGWHRYDLPMGVTAEPWNGQLYFGSGDGSGRLLVNDGYLDGVTLADPNAYRAIDFSLITAFSNLGRPTRKRVQQIVVEILSQGGSIPLNAEARYNFDLSEAAAPSGAPSAATAATWDTALWDEAQWSGSYQSERQTFGAVGEGTEVALAIRGSATSRLTLVGIDLFYDEGGYR